jgi:hypothetical protein
MRFESKKDFKKEKKKGFVNWKAYLSLIFSLLLFLCISKMISGLP